MRDPRTADLERVAAMALGAIERDEVLDAAVPRFVLRRYLCTEGAALRDALGLALAQSLSIAAGDTSVIGRSAWLTLLVEATAVADDERIVPAAGALAAGLRAQWAGQTRIDEASASVEACLRAAEILPIDGLVQDAIDQLERVVGGSYRPGDGLIRERDGIGRRCALDDQVRAASALLTAFELTGRLPYSMLAEELTALVGREPTPGAAIATRCHAAHVLCRLAALHDDPGYRGAAVIAAGADYRADASRILSDVSGPALAGTPSDAAAYGFALGELLQYVR